MPDGWLQGLRKFIGQTASTGHGPEDYAVTYRLTLNGRQTLDGTLQDLQAYLAGEITTRLAAAPERLAPDARMVNDAFSSGALQAEVDERGTWFTVVDAHGDDPLRVKITREE